MPGKPGSCRLGDGLRLRSICEAEKPTNSANSSDSQPVFSAANTLPPPIMPPSRMPGASASTIFQRTAPCLWWARTDDSEVNRMVDIEVAIAIWTIASSGKASQLKVSVRNGTIIMPPPTPSSPAQKPVNAPSSNSAGIRERVMRGSLRDVFRYGYLAGGACTARAHRTRFSGVPSAAW
ncbi:hypothetical protein OJJOAM_001230 [Cupriavidus sp. H18C1]